MTAYLGMIPPQFIAYETDKIYNNLKDCDFAGAGLEALNFVPVGGVVKGESTVVRALSIAFKTEHGMRHFEGTNLTSEAIEAAIKSDILKKGGAGIIGETVQRQINVQEQI
ncbi:MAG TPA: hypothetical protein VJG66_02355 [Patescibacteria group bacterium]|nr:hypothetical protein [Patescibacteria group bacterium]